MKDNYPRFIGQVGAVAMGSVTIKSGVGEGTRIEIEMPAPAVSRQLAGRRPEPFMPRANSKVNQMKPRELVEAWVDAFNQGDIDKLVSLYSKSAVNYQVPEEPVEGREHIRAMFEREFASIEMTCIVENIFEDGDWAILEWRDPQGLRGCGFFRVSNGEIIFQRGYWDKLSFLRKHNLPVPDESK